MMQTFSVARFLNKAIKNTILNNLASLEGNNKKFRLVAVSCGFAKNFLQSKISTNKPKNYKYGDDAYFISQKPGVADVIGVADGVGGWRNYGIDPGEFSSFLMSTCSRLVQSSNFNPERPVSLIASSYNELLEHKEPILGSSTACVLILNKENNMLYAANIGDSGFMVVRKGSIVHQSEEQTHYFNTPYQLSSPFHNSNVLSDRPESADEISFPVQKGDVILVATDGVFDNLPSSLILDTLTQIEGVYDPVKLQMCANSIALMARQLSFDGKFLSPFAVNARKNNINAIGGKPDDVTVVLATVADNTG
uniref:Protein phosphatase n=1 Tax=Culicoides sonorensis TaxID=179676 RepID=A0A336LUM1_CULSO